MAFPCFGLHFFLFQNVSPHFASKYQYLGGGYFNQSSLLLAQQSQLFGLSSLNADTLFTQQTVGGTVNFSAPFAAFNLKKYPKLARFARMGLSYTLSTNKTIDPKINRDADPTNDVASYATPRILTSRVSPYFSYSSLNSSLDPTMGMSVQANLQLAGGFLGGDVNVFSPTVDFKYFRPVFHRRSDKPHVIGMHFLGQHALAFGKRFDANSLAFVGGVPIYERFFLGGEYDIRGYNVRSIAPLATIEKYLSTQNVKAQITDPTDSTKLIDAPAGYIAPSAIRSFTYDAPEKTCLAGASATCNVVKGVEYPSPIGGDTSLVYNLEYRIPILSVLSVAAFADVGTVFNMRRFKNDQLSVTNFVGQQIRTGVTLNPAGRVATAEELTNAAGNDGTLPPGYRQVSVFGDSRTFDVVRLSAITKDKIFSDVRASLGAEIRVQVPMLNVPFRLIFAYNPNANIGPTAIYLERRTAIRFAVGRTF